MWRQRCCQWHLSFGYAFGGDRIHMALGGGGGLPVGGRGAAAGGEGGHARAELGRKKKEGARKISPFRFS